SSLSGTVLPPETVYFGEIGLSGAVRPVAQAGARLKEAQKLGFAKAMMPQGRGETTDRALATESLRHIADLVAGIASGAPRRVGSGRGRSAPRYEEAD
ncbi:DNA repair protein RadA, partial [Methylobacterium trifolii]